MTPTDPRPTTAFDRRRFLALGAGAGITALAGCSAGPTASGGSDGGDGSASGPSAESTGGFRLLISDQPSDIGDFDSLVVTLAEARVFGGRGADEDGEEDDEEVDVDDGGNETDVNATGDGGNVTDVNATGSDDDADGPGDDDADGPGDDADGTGDDGDDDERGFSILDLGGATVDLTEVVGEKATSVFDGELPEGRYTKVELHVTQVDGVVDGDEVDVKLPSEKLQITNNFEVVSGETLSFVFDITVVKKGPGGYNLLPVISESGVAGRDVEVEEVGADGQDDDETPEGGGDGGDGGGPPETTPGNPGGDGGADTADS